MSSRYAERLSTPAVNSLSFIIWQQNTRSSPTRNKYKLPSPRLRRLVAAISPWRPRVQFQTRLRGVCFGRIISNSKNNNNNNNDNDNDNNNLILKCIFHRNAIHICTKWHWQGFVADCFGFSLPILFHHCSILIHH